MDYKQYFKQKNAELAPNQFSRKEAMNFCNKLTKLGCKIDICIDEEDDGTPHAYSADEVYADEMLVTLPKSLNKRFDVLVSIFEAYPNEISTDSISIKKVNWKKDKTVHLWWD